MNYIYKYVKVEWIYVPGTDDHGLLDIPDGWELVQFDEIDDLTRDAWVVLRREAA